MLGLSGKELVDFIQGVGVPSVALLWILMVGSRNSRDMTSQLRSIERSVTNLTITIQDAIHRCTIKEG